MKSARPAFFVSLFCLLAAPAFAQITGGSCSASNLSGTYTLTLSGRAISAAGSFAGSFQGNGTATFDGVSNVTFTGTVNTNLATGKSFVYSGTYTIPSNCSGTLTLTNGSTATFTIVAWGSGERYDMAGSDATYIYTGSGYNVRPVSCATSTLSGPYTYDATGFTVSGTAQTGSADEAGVFQFDGQGNVTASYTQTSSGTTPAPITATGTYSVTSNCLASATLMDSTGKSNALNFVIQTPYGDTALLLEANSQFVRTGTAYSAATNPTESIANVASYAVNYTPAGSVFALFGVGLATGETQATAVPLPMTLRNTTVTVISSAQPNGEQAPLFYVDTGQIDAQMPWDVPGGTIATVIVQNGSTKSNAAAVYVPATGTAGISTYSNNRAVVVNKDGSVNSATDAAAVGDEVVAYFTGGGPVTASGKLTTGAASPAGLSPITGTYTVTVGGVQATTVEYIGLTPGSVGLYQVNFNVPNVAKGTYPLVITINGQASNAPVMTVSN